MKTSTLIIGGLLAGAVVLLLKKRGTPAGFQSGGINYAQTDLNPLASSGRTDAWVGDWNRLFAQLSNDVNGPQSLDPTSSIPRSINGTLAALGA